MISGSSWAQISLMFMLPSPVLLSAP